MKKTSKTKVFCIGAPKTGTSTLREVFRILGYSIKKGDGNLEDIYYRGRRELIWKTVYKFDSFHNNPWNLGDFYKELDKKFPDSKFILTVRDSEDWVSSIEKWMVTSFWFSQKVFGKIDPCFFDKEKVKKEFEKRNTEVIRYFSKGNNLLKIDITKNGNWDVICEFLNISVPNYNFPYKNRTSKNFAIYFLQRDASYVWGRFVKLVRKNYENRYFS